MTGKIIKGIAGFYYVHDGHETVYECRAKGIFRSRGIKPVVGDNVEFVVLDEEKAEGSIEEKCACPSGIGKCGSGACGVCDHTAGAESESARSFPDYDGGTGDPGHNLF